MTTSQPIHASQNQNEKRQTEGTFSISSSKLQVVPRQEHSPNQDGKQQQDGRGYRDSLRHRLGLLHLLRWPGPGIYQGKIGWLPMIRSRLNPQRNLWLIRKDTLPRRSGIAVVGRIPLRFAGREAADVETGSIEEQRPIRSVSRDCRSIDLGRHSRELDQTAARVESDIRHPWSGRRRVIGRNISGLAKRPKVDRALPVPKSD